MMQNRIRTIGVLLLAGTPFYVLCFMRHICVAGHMQHGPYPWYEYANDLWWAGCFAAAAVLAFRVRPRRRRWMIFSSLCLLVLRLPLESLHGMSALLELPVLSVMDFCGLMYVVRPRKYMRGRRRAELVNARQGA